MSVLIVIICSLTLSFGAAIGVNIQKLSMNKEEQKHPNNTNPDTTNPNRRPPYLQPLWLLGMIIIIIDGCGDFVFIGMAPQSLLAPLGSLSIGWNIILAPIFHPKEKVTKGIIISTVVIYIGTLFTILNAASSNPTYTLKDIIEYCTHPHFIMYGLSCIAFEIGVICHGWRNENGFGIIHYCALAGCFGGQCIICAKTTSELVKNAIITKVYDDFTTSLVPYIFVVGLIMTIVTQLHFLNTGLAKFDALIVVPVYQSFWNVFSITGGLLFFQEYHGMTVSEGWLYSFGIVITLLGVSMLVKQRSRSMVLPGVSHHDDYGVVNMDEEVDLDMNIALVENDEEKLEKND